MKKKKLSSKILKKLNHSHCMGDVKVYKPYNISLIANEDSLFFISPENETQEDYTNLETAPKFIKDWIEYELRGLPEEIACIRKKQLCWNPYGRMKQYDPFDKMLDILADCENFNIPESFKERGLSLKEILQNRGPLHKDIKAFCNKYGTFTGRSREDRESVDEFVCTIENIQVIIGKIRGRYNETKKQSKQSREKEKEYKNTIRNAIYEYKKQSAEISPEAEVASELAKLYTQDLERSLDPEKTECDDNADFRMIINTMLEGVSLRLDSSESAITYYFETLKQAIGLYFAGFITNEYVICECGEPFKRAHGNRTHCTKKCAGKFRKRRSRTK